MTGDLQPLCSVCWHNAGRPHRKPVAPVGEVQPCAVCGTPTDDHIYVRRDQLEGVRQYRRAGLRHGGQGRLSGDSYR